MSGDNDRILTRVLAGPPVEVHMAGVCGIGMAGLACMLLQRGHRVTGCDLAAGEMADWLRERGVIFSSGHSPGHISGDVSLVIRSSAVPETGPEIQAARDAGIPVLRRGEVLAWLINNCFSVAVCGTHGKTTTSSFAAQILKSAGKNVSWCIGGEVPGLGGAGGMSVADEGESVAVAEADESDGTLALYGPEVLVVTNIEYDHMEHFSDEEEFRSCFMSAVKSTRKRVVYCMDDDAAAGLVAQSGVSNTVSYGFSDNAFIRAGTVREEGSCQYFSVTLGDGQTAEAKLPYPGRHNVLNALAAVAAVMECGLDLERAVELLAEAEMPRRRMDIVYAGHGITVMSDYSHHPTEIRALLASLRIDGVKRVRAVYQPHRYTRTLALRADFPPAFESVDELVLLPVYPASEEPIEGGCIADLYSEFRAQSLAPVLEMSIERACTYYRDTLMNGDLLLVIGAGDVERIALTLKTILSAGKKLPSQDLDDLAEELKSIMGFVSGVARNEPVGRKTTYGVGGAADIWVDVETEQDLRSLLEYAGKVKVECTVFGGGSNIVVPDTGVRGISLRLGGEPFRQVSYDEDGKYVVAGAGVSSTRFSKWMAEHGYKGYEFLAGIPGCLGGALRMNAGRCGCRTGDTVLWARYLLPGGEECIVDRSELVWSYRKCSLPDGAVIIEAGFSCALDAPEAEVLAELEARRDWMKGVRCAGSVFRNPPEGASAGRLLDEAGMKGFSVGGARVSEDHANVIVAGPDSRASDIIALIEMMRGKVSSSFDVELCKEVRIL